MTWGIAVAVFSVLFTLFTGFAATMRSIGRLEAKFDIMWSWYLRETSSARPDGRRYYDPAARRDGHDGGEPGGG